MLDVSGVEDQKVYVGIRPEGFIYNPNGEMTCDLSNIEDKDSILLIQDSKETPYSSINKILSGYDKFIKLKDTDTVVFAEPSYDSSEKTLVKVQNDLAIRGCDIEAVPKDKTILQL